MTQEPNIDVESNIWINADDPTGLANNIHEASKRMPGDLAIHLIVGSTDSREIRKALLTKELTNKQYNEFISYKFFLPFNHLTNKWISPEINQSQ